MSRTAHTPKIEELKLEPYKDDTDSSEDDKTMDEVGGKAKGKEKHFMREFVTSIGVLTVFLAIVYLLELKHTPWSDFLDTADGFLGLRMRVDSWSMQHRLGFVLLLFVTVAIEIVWAIAAIWLDKHLFRAVCLFPSGQTLLMNRRRNYGKGGATSHFGTVVAFTAYPMLVSWTFSAVYRTTSVRAWCYIFYVFSVVSSALLSFLPKLMCCDVSLLMPKLPEYSSRYYKKE